MPFYAPIFLFLLLPGCLFLYLLAPPRWRNAVLLLASLLFYAWGEPRFVFVVLASASFDWYCGNVIAAGRPLPGRIALAAGVAANVALLGYFKYANFFADTLGRLVAHFGGALAPLAKIALPIGISFIVFEKITYLVDLNRRIGVRASAFADYLLYVFFFPKLLAGPIVKYHDIAGQLSHRRTTFHDVEQGFMRFALGLAKKVFIADTMGEVVDPVFALSGSGLSTGLAWMGLGCFTLQIFFDFSGYSDMAIGLARVFGFRLRENFNDPYIATSFTDFWHRWHISLSSWVREYLYFPLGGNRRGTARTYVNLWTCFLLSGLWHGANWTYVVWGAYHGSFLVLDKWWWLDWQRRVSPWLARGATLLLVMIGWVVFRARDFNHCLAYLSAMAGAGAPRGAFVDVAPNVIFFAGLGAFLSLAPGSASWRAAGARLGGWRYRQEAALAGIACVFLLAVAKAVTITFNPFLYFRF